MKGKDNEQNEFVPDSAVYKSRVSALAQETDIFTYHPKTIDDHYKFIKRRELYRLDASNSIKHDFLSGVLQQTSYSKESCVYLSKFANHKLRVGFMPSSTPVPPPPNFGARFTKGLTKNARSKIRNGVEYLHSVSSTLPFITLSYSDDALPKNHKIAKKHLSTFFKALYRHTPDISYVWVAEIQPMRLKTKGVSAIHFHIASTKYVNDKWLRKTWRRITGCDKVLPNVIKVSKPKHYMSKYLSKSSHIDEGEKEGSIHWIGGDRYGMSHDVASSLKPLSTVLIKASYFDYIEFAHDIANKYSNDWASDYCLQVRCPDSLNFTEI